MGRGTHSGASVLGIGRKVSGLRSETTKNQDSQGFTADRKAWKEKEKARIADVMKSLREDAYNMASTNESWREYLRNYAEMPHYSAFNMDWARAQLRHKETEAPGLIFSESVWKNLGRRVKAEYCSPHGRSSKKRDARFGYDGKREWDSKYVAEMLSPMGYPVKKRDADGNPILDDDGNPITFFKPATDDRGLAMYKAFDAYHEDATEALDGGDPPPLPDSPWIGATGTIDDAADLMALLEVDILPGQKLEKESGTVSGNASARLAGKKIVLDESDDLIDQTNSLLGCVCEHVGKKLGESKGKALTEEEQERQAAAIASAQYVIASLYKIDNKEQSFPHLNAVRDQKDGVRKLGGEVYAIVSNILADIDPITRAKLNR